MSEVTPIIPRNKRDTCWTYQVDDTTQNNENIDGCPDPRPKTRLWLVQKHVHRLL